MPPPLPPVVSVSCVGWRDTAKAAQGLRTKDALTVERTADGAEQLTAAVAKRMTPDTAVFVRRRHFPMLPVDPAAAVTEADLRDALRVTVLDEPTPEVRKKEATFDVTNALDLPPGARVVGDMVIMADGVRIPLGHFQKRGQAQPSGGRFGGGFDTHADPFGQPAFGQPAFGQPASGLFGQLAPGGLFGQPSPSGLFGQSSGGAFSGEKKAMPSKKAAANAEPSGGFGGGGGGCSWGDTGPATFASDAGMFGASSGAVSKKAAAPSAGATSAWGAPPKPAKVAASGAAGGWTSATPAWDAPTTFSFES